MALRHAIGDTLEIGHGVWLAELSPDDVRRIGEGQFSVGGRSVVGVSGAVYIRETRMLSIDPGSAIVLNIGESKEVCFVELLDENKLITKSEIVDGADKKPLDNSLSLKKGDNAFLDACTLHLDVKLVELITRILSEIRARYPGYLREGLARKWVNHPGNYMAITIQNRDRSFAIHVKGSPKQFNARSIDIKADRGSYCRFKLRHDSQFDDALKVILASARSTEGY